MAPAAAPTPCRAATGASGMDPSQTQITQLLIRRRRSAILAADVAGYSRLMGTDEEQTLKRLDAARTIMDSRIVHHGGRIANTAGDSVIAEFNSPVAAVRCAIEVQTALRQRNKGQNAEERLQFRIGINYGEVMANRADLLGDNVNVAARIENLAQPGGILISESVHEEVYGRINVPFRPLGPQALKNIDRKVTVFEVMLGVVVEPPAPAGARKGPLRPATATRAAPRRAPSPAARGPWPLLAALGLVVLIALGAIAYLVMTALAPSRAPAPAATAAPAPPPEAPAPPPEAAADTAAPVAVAPAPADPAALAAAVNAALAGFSCARLRAEAPPPESAGSPPALALAGYVGAAADLDAAVARLQAVPGVGPIDRRVAIMPPPLCGVLDALPAAAVLAAGAADGPRLAVGGADGFYRAGESLRLTVTAPPGHDGYLYVDYIDSQDDVVAHLLPNDVRPDARIAAGQQIVIGELPAERGRYQVAAPFGTHMILVVSTRVPLFDASSPSVLDSRTAYLPRLAQALQAHPDARIAYAPLTFAPQ